MNIAQAEIHKSYYVYTVRLSNAVSTETFKGDLDFLTNKGLADRIDSNMNIAQAEIHKSYYVYTITADLEKIGIDENDKIELETNKGLADRIDSNMNIAQAEIHKSYYVYTITADLEKIGIDENDKIELDNNEKCRRIQKLLDTVALLYRDIRGRRENLSPLFAVGGVYDIKNPIFENLVSVKENKFYTEI